MATKISGAEIEFPDGTEQNTAYKKAGTFRAYASTTTAIGGGALQKVNIGATEYDVTSSFNTVTSRFQPKIAGYYQVNGAVYAPGNSTAAIIKNGAASSAVYGSGGTTRSTVSDVVYLNGTTNFLELWVFTDTAATVQAGRGNTYLSGYLVEAI